jgi:PAS domain S-box-containing protein
MLKKMLVELGHTVIEAEDGMHGWDVLKKKRIRIVIGDCMMPGLNGLELCKKIRSEPFEEYIYVIMLTAQNSKDDLVEVFRAGADDYMLKPFDPEELKARVMTGLRVIDLEERHKSLAHTLIESRNKLRIVIDSQKEEIVSLDRDMTIVSVNKAFAHRMKSSPQDVVGKNYFDKTVSEYNFCSDNSILSLVANVFENGSEVKKLFTTVDANGNATYLQISCLPIHDEFKKVFQVVIVSQDITEERRNTEKIRSLNEQLLETSAKIETRNAELKNTLKRLEDTQAQMIQSEKMAFIGQLAAGVAHEINNPTGFVSSNLKTLLNYHNDIAQLIEKYHKLIVELESAGNKNKIPEPIKKGIHKIKSFEGDIDIGYLMEDVTDLIDECRQGTDRIKKIVMDLKDFAHPGEDRIQSMDINSRLESTLNVVNNEIKYKATVKRDFYDIPAIKGHPQQLNQVFMNILVNAVQAIEKKGEIVVKTRHVNEHVEIKISDTGCGIPQENLDKIFDPFFTTKAVGKGTGLGMNIAYNIVKKHNGAIEADSEVGKGTTFTIKIPVNAFNGQED